MAEPDDDTPVDRPEDVPVQRSAVEGKRERRARESVAEKDRRELAAWLSKQLADPIGRKFLWGLLEASDAFSIQLGFGPHGHPHPEGSWLNLGRHEFGQRLYHSWSALDRAGTLSLMDEFHPHFPKPKGKR